MEVLLLSLLNEVAGLALKVNLNAEPTTYCMLDTCRSVSVVLPRSMRLRVRMKHSYIMIAYLSRDDETPKKSKVAIGTWLFHSLPLSF